MDTKCQSKIKAIDDFAEDEPANKPFSEAHTGLDLGTYPIIGGGILIFIVVLVGARYLQQKEERKIGISPTFDTPKSPAPEVKVDPPAKVEDEESK